MTRRPPHRRARHTPGWWIGRASVHVIVAIFMIVWFTPILGLFVTSLRNQSDMAVSGWWIAFINPMLTGYNYQKAIQYVGVGSSAATSLAIAVPVTVMTALISAIGAFALTRMEFRARKLLSLALVAMLVIPPQLTIVPLLKLFVRIGMNGTVPAVWIYQVGFTVPFGIFLIRGFISSIPEELFESAEIDGASVHQIFRSIVLPLCAPILASLAILQFLWSWNDLLIPLIFLGGSRLAAPITVQAAGIATTNGQDQTVLMAATFLSVLLPLIILLSMQRYFVRGILGGAVKG